MAQQPEKRPVGRPVGSVKGTKKQYGFIQLEKETYELLREYCIENGYKIGSLAAVAIRKHIKYLKSN